MARALTMALAAVLGLAVSAEDCNLNGVDDETDIAAGTSQDCNENGVPDECDIARGTSEDLDGDGVPDECIFFVRGDLHPVENPDGKVGLTDPIWLIASFLFGEDKTLNCPDAADVNDDGKIGLTDAIVMLSCLFDPFGNLRRPCLLMRCQIDVTDDDLDQFAKHGKCVYSNEGCGGK